MPRILRVLEVLPSLVKTYSVLNVSERPEGSSLKLEIRNITKGMNDSGMASRSRFATV